MYEICATILPQGQPSATLSPWEHGLYWIGIANDGPKATTLAVVTPVPADLNVTYVPAVNLSGDPSMTFVTDIGANPAWPGTTGWIVYLRHYLPLPRLSPSRGPAREVSSREPASEGLLSWEEHRAELEASNRRFEEAIRALPRTTRRQYRALLDNCREHFSCHYKPKLQRLNESSLSDRFQPDSLRPLQSIESDLVQIIRGLMPGVSLVSQTLEAKKFVAGQNFEAKQVPKGLPQLWRLFSFILPRKIRERVFEPAYKDMLAEYMQARRCRTKWAKRWLAAAFTIRSVFMVVDASGPSARTKRLPHWHGSSPSA
jgi:hypothetical protein